MNSNDKDFTVADLREMKEKLASAEHFPMKIGATLYEGKLIDIIIVDDIKPSDDI